MRQRNLGQEKGITLIALVITIIVMLILVGVTITIAVNGGLFDYAKYAATKTNEAKEYESGLANGTIDDLINYYSPSDTTTPRIIFNANGGTFSSNNQIAIVTGEVGSTADMPNKPSRNGYAFTGWYEATEGNDIAYTGEESTVTIPETSTEVYAHWQADLTNATLNVGDRVCLTNRPSETFRVIETSSGSTSTVKLLAERNLNSTGTAQENGTATARFDDDSSSYDASGCEIKQIVWRYEAAVLDPGAESGVEYARLLLKTEIDALNGGNDTTISFTSDFPSWAKNTSYWLGTRKDGYNVWYVGKNNGAVYASTYTITTNYGVRPVMILLKSRLSPVSEENNQNTEEPGIEIFY